MSITDVYSMPTATSDPSGVTDTQALANASALAGPGGTLELHPMTYIVTGVPLTSSQRIIIPYGCKVQLANAANAAVFTVNGAACVIEGEGTIDGNLANQTSANAHGILIGTSAGQVIIKGGLNIINVYGRGITTSDGTNTNLPNGSVFEDLFLTNIRQDGLWLQTGLGVDAWDVKVRRIHVDKSMQAAATAIGYGVAVHGRLSGSAGYLRNPVITDLTARLPVGATNTMFGLEVWGGSGGAVNDAQVSRIHSYGGSGVSFDHCNNGDFDTIKSYAAGIELASCTECGLGGAWSIDMQGQKSIGLIFDGPTANPASLRCNVTGGIISNLASGSGAVGPVYWNGADHCSITGTTIRCGSAGQAMYLQNALNSQITSCHLYAGSAATGITLDGSQGANIDDNTADGFTTTFVDAYSGTASAVLDNIKVGSGNRLTNMSGKPVLRKNPFSASGVTLGANCLVLGARDVVTKPAFAATLTPDPFTAGVFRPGVLTANVTIAAPTNAATGQPLTVILQQDATGGRTVTWNAAFVNTPTANTAASAYTIGRFVYDGTSWIGV